MTAPTRTGLTAPARQALRGSVLSIGAAVAATAAALVAGVLGMTAAYLWWQARPPEQTEAPHPGELRLSIDAAHVLLGVTAIGVVAVVIAGVASVLIARRAMRPLQEAFERQRRFVADASHELRTPLTVLHARIQLLQRRVGTDERTAPIVEGLAADADALIAILNELLDASGDPQASPVAGRTELGPVLQEAVGLATTAADGGVQVRHSPAELIVAMPPEQLLRCVVALLENALDHSPARGVVTVEAARTGRFATIDVHDDGDALPAQDAERLFDRFAHRRTPDQPAPSSWPVAPPPAGGPVPTRDQSHGLGLFLVREVVSRYGGTAAVAPTGGSGTTIRLLLPVVP